MKKTGRKITGGFARGTALVSSMGISFFGGVDPDTGVVMEPGHDLEGICIKDKILVFPSGKGSTVGSYILYRLKKKQLAPAGIINRECEPIIAVGCIIAEIPCVDLVEMDDFKSGDQILLDADSGSIEITKS